MNATNSELLEERVVLLPPSSKDAAVAEGIFRETKIPCKICPTFGDFCIELERGVGVGILPAEALIQDYFGVLPRLLTRQPQWSDIPLVVMLPLLSQMPEAHDAFSSYSHLTFVRRPIDLRTFTSTIRAALRDRRRQYERRAYLIERERHIEQFRQNDKRKDEFLAMLAHELRNPLAAVNNAISVLKMSDDPENIDFAKDVVDRQVKQLVRLIDDLLDVSRITSGKIRLRKELVDAGSIIEQAFESVRPLINQRNHTLVHELDGSSLTLFADPTRIEQILVNLLTNAAKYTENGGRINVSIRENDGDIVFSIRDTGIGIPPERLPEMFQLFAQGERSIARSEGGLGIGLTIVRKLAEMHGGSVCASSDGLGKGSEFVVRLPAAKKEFAEPAQTSKEVAETSKKSRILVVDDNEDTAAGIGRLLKLLGNEVKITHDGPSAIEIAKSYRPDFLLLDIGLPGMDGYQVASKLRCEGGCRNTVIIAISGYGQFEDRKRSRAAGFDHHLVKPVELNTLVTLLSSAHA